MWAKVDEEIGKRLEEELNKLGGDADHSKVPPSQAALANHRK
jgi:catalase